MTVTLLACSGGDKRPSAAETDQHGGDGGRVTTGGDVDSGGSPAGDADIPQTCKDGTLNGNETDVDCGGNACAPCGDGKNCVQNNDCQGGSCTQNKCSTAQCNDGLTNGGESDTDCGGSSCAKCTIGKRCNEADDCVSGACVNNYCGCPAGMSVVSKASGGAYCIDAVEVTKAAYNKFLTANVPVTGQIAECAPPANPTFVPRDAWPPAQYPPGPPVVQNGLGFNLSLPVHYVDWCDAYAYCKWANKQLCGKINGGSVDPASANDATQNAWYNACSSQGTKDWPYGTGYLGKCNGDDIGSSGPTPTYDGYGYSENNDTGVYTVIDADSSGNYTVYTHAACQGGPVGVFQMSGNVAEWEDSCDGTASTSSCRLRGGSYKANGNSAALACKADRMEQRLPSDSSVLADVGFRCCLY